MGTILHEKPKVADDLRTPDQQAVLDTLLDGLVVISRDGRILQLNAAAGEILEVSSESTPGRLLEDLVGADHPLAVLTNQVRQSRGPASIDGVTIRRRFGHDLELEISISPISQEPIEAKGIAPLSADLVVLLHDRTMRNSLRAEASQREKLASYGHIAAGIAHEVKNPLSGIRGAAELLAMRAADDRTKRTADLITREVDRITALVEELMVFAKGEALKLAPLNLHRLIDHVLALLESDPISSGVDFVRAYDPSIPDLVADADRLTQVFLNLARNALQAMDQAGGTLTVSTRMLLEGRLVASDGRPTPTVELTFSDTGSGISPDILDRLATPFFTTKSTGTGLGLAVSRHWISRHGGRIQIENDPKGAGACVRVDLPLRADRMAAALSRENGAPSDH